MILLDDEFGEVVVPSESELTPQPLVNTVEFEVEPEVSLHALTNASNLQIFHLATSYRDHSVEVLIDTGSHNNFIQEGLVDQLGLQLVSASRFCVYMGNGHFLLCDRIYIVVPLKLQGHEFLVDLYVLPICVLDIVLGM